MYQDIIAAKKVNWISCAVHCIIAAVKKVDECSGERIGERQLVSVTCAVLHSLSQSPDSPVGEQHFPHQGGFVRHLVN